jgi:hypothetical protein
LNASSAELGSGRHRNKSGTIIRHGDFSGFSRNVVDAETRGMGSTGIGVLRKVYRRALQGLFNKLNRHMPETRCCYVCKVNKDFSLFPKDKRKKHGIKYYCRACDADMQRVWVKANPEASKRRDARVGLSKFGLSFADLEKLKSLGDGTCWICKDSPAKRELDVDHVHQDGPTVVRGLLCSMCNVGLGLLQDSEELLERGALYIEKHKRLEIGWFKAFRSTPRAKEKKQYAKRGPRVLRDTPPGMRYCGYCKDTLPETAFRPTLAKNGKYYYSTYCRSCAVKYLRVWDKANPDACKTRTRSAQLRLYFGITLEDYEYLKTQQSDSCGLCFRDSVEGNRLAVDHDASRGKEAVRGLLCRNCNLGIGAFKDSPAILREAIQYLAEAEGKTPEWWGKVEDAPPVPRPRKEAERCNVPGCADTASRKGMCQNHYRKEMRRLKSIEPLA